MEKIIKATIKIREDFVNSLIKENYFKTKIEGIEEFNYYLKEGNIFILNLNNEFVGFFNYIKDYSHSANYLEEIYILKRFRRKGFGKLLLKKYIFVSKKDRTKHNIALSSTTVNNIVSQKLHENFGFEKIGILKGLHYGTDEIFYSFDLGGKK